MAIYMKNIRNFSIIAHIDHGKSTLADRLLEYTNTVEKRKMREQVLDQMDLERERGITIKMQPVKMKYGYKNEEYTFNLIDTPGHIDFSYEVSRALKAVEGVILLVDGTQGVQAQTLTVLEMAKQQDLVIIPVISKIDVASAQINDVKLSLMSLLDCEEEDIILTSGKTGAGVSDLLEAVIKRVPPPKSSHPEGKRALVFDFEYSTHQGVIVYARVFDGQINKNDQLIFSASDEKFQALEVGMLAPAKIKQEKIMAGDIGYIVTGIKDPGRTTVGDTVTDVKKTLDPIAGYMLPAPVVWASVYPSSQDDFDVLRHSLERLRLSDSSLSFDEESSGVLGRGFRCGFLGMLHMEIVSERLKREFDLDLIVTTPSISYEIEEDGQRSTTYSPHLFPEDTKRKTIYESWVTMVLMVTKDYISPVMQLLHEHEGFVVDTKTLEDGRTMFTIEMPLRELMRNFFDDLKSVTAGFASVSYEITDTRQADVTRLDILVAEDVVPAFSRVVSKKRVEKEAKEAVEKLAKLLPRQLITVKIQAQSEGRIISSKTLSALKKDVAGYLYGGDITRKMKLREKQKKGKKKMQKLGKVNIPQEVFLKMVKNQEK